MVKLIFYIRYALGGLGLYLAFSQLTGDVSEAVATATVFSVGIVGVLSFVSHTLLHEGDAKMIGFSRKTPSFQYEVGFANLAFGIVAILSYFQEWGIRANTAILLAYAIYMLQAAVLHFFEKHQKQQQNRATIIRGGLALLFGGFMLYIALQAINSPVF